MYSVHILLVVSSKGKKRFCNLSCFWPPTMTITNWSRETGPAAPSRVSLLISILRLNLVLTHGIRSDFRKGKASKCMYLLPQPGQS